jgi:hypothetical protein
MLKLTLIPVSVTPAGIPATLNEVVVVALSLIAAEIAPEETVTLPGAVAVTSPTVKPEQMLAFVTVVVDTIASGSVIVIAIGEFVKLPTLSVTYTS